MRAAYRTSPALLVRMSRTRVTGSAEHLRTGPRQGIAVLLGPWRPSLTLAGVVAGALPFDVDVTIDRSAAPARVRQAFDALVDRHPSVAMRLAERDDVTTALVAVLAASRSLTRTIQTSPAAALDTLGELDLRR